MFAHRQFHLVGAFTPSALPDFFAIPASIPDRGPLPCFLFGLLRLTRRGSIPLQEPSDLPGSFLVSMCCSMPSATPGKRSIARLSAISLVACFSCESFGLPNFGSFGASYRIQLLSLH